jgi:phosphatidylserine/phosphatidylglycerophosphate/cardiolipin synthase-like enzyme
MKLTPFAITEIAGCIKDIQSGKLWVAFFNSFGSRDVYDSLGLPDIGKSNGQRPSKTEYIVKRLTESNGTYILSDIIVRMACMGDLLPQRINSIIGPEHFYIEEKDGKLVLIGDVQEKNGQDTETEAHFQDIQNKILNELDAARVSIHVVMAWFTNETLSTKLIEKYNEGLDVQVAIYDDSINRRHGVDLAEVPTTRIKSSKGGIMHNKFCVIDNQVVITGSYNWSSNAEFKNDENISILRDNKVASDYSVEYRNLTK